jgi:hypothetical protein
MQLIKHYNITALPICIHRRDHSRYSFPPGVYNPTLSTSINLPPHHFQMATLPEQEVFDQWWDQALDIALTRTKTFILDAKMGLDADVNATDDLVYDTDDSEATPIFHKTAHTNLQYHKFLRFADDLLPFVDPVLLASQTPAKSKIIRCPCQFCPSTSKFRFKSYRDLRRHARRSSFSSGHNEHDVLDFFIGALLSRVTSSY